MLSTVTFDIHRDAPPPGRRPSAIERLDGDVAGVLADVKLLVSELITNSVKYGGHGAVTLLVDVDGPAASASRSSTRASGSSPSPAIGP